MAKSHSSEPAVHESGEQARAGETRGVVRYILGISLFLVVVVFALLFLAPNLFRAG